MEAKHINPQEAKCHAQLPEGIFFISSGTLTDLKSLACRALQAILPLPPLVTRGPQSSFHKP